MPILALAVIGLQIFMAVHVIRNGKTCWWISLILFFPLIGSLVYFFVEVMPTLQTSPKVVRMDQARWHRAMAAREREVKSRLAARNKQAVMDALVAKAELDLPKSSVQAELDRMIESARADLKQRGIKDADKAPIPDDIFRPQAERRVRLGLVVAELVRSNDLQAKPEQVKAHVEELAASYEKPTDVIRWYFSDTRRLAEVEAIVIENNVTDFVLAKAKVTAKDIAFAHLMGQLGLTQHTAA